MRTRLLIYVLLPFVGACSSTIQYRATGSYALDPSSGVVVSCSDAAGTECTEFALDWETERYCGIYKKASDSLSDEQLRVGSSPTTVDEWEEHEGKTVFQGDDEKYEVVVGEEVLIASDPLCGQFRPPVNLVAVREGDELTLEIYCKPIVSGIALMPPSPEGYPLKVVAVSVEKTLLGCGR